MLMKFNVQIMFTLLSSIPIYKNRKKFCHHTHFLNTCVQVLLIYHEYNVKVVFLLLMPSGKHEKRR